MIPSLQKLLGLIAIIWVVYTAFRIYETRQAAIRAQADDPNEDHTPADSDPVSGASDDSGSVELRECEICSAWVSGENCRRENCPY
jgi:uncharacterized membrane protein YebE (DUF533 family)